MSKTKAPALLFDLDGTLVHSDPIHFVVFRDIFAEHGVSLEWDEFTTEVVGRPNPEIFAHFLPDQAHRAAELADRKEAEFRSRLTGSFEPTPGILGLLDWAERSGAPFAVVTNAPRANAEAMLSASGLASRFEMVIAEGDAPQAKPDPAPYLLAMERLGVAPEASIAFEDSRSGNRAARASGAHVFGLTSNLAPEALLQAGAHQAIADFNDPALWAHLDQRRT
ncbi:HAD family hydrolase [Amaricoccus macauensis]|uniref:HAD family hydrolase n=1 Tax=Amaricoccus macauensis TaxID=57001 RepID=UPI003C7C9479